MNSCQMLHTFEFKNKLVFDKHVNAVPAVKFRPFVSNGNCYLARHFKAVLLKFISQTLLVCRLKQARSKMLVDFNCTADDAI